MAPSTAKRTLSSRLEPIKPRKRQKLQQADHSSLPKRTVRLDHLQWREVEIPDRLDDYEGFMGLEEIEDVAVIADQETGRLSFATSKPEIATIEQERRRSSSHNQSPLPDVNDASDNGSWAGFSDDDKAEELVSANTPSIEEEKARDSAESKKKKKTRTAQRVVPESDTNSTMPFQILQDVAQDTGEDQVDISAWDGLGLSKTMLGALRRLRFTKPTPIQLESIPHILDGHDLIGKAATGSGKSLAFLIPILESFLLELRWNPTLLKGASKLALIVLPTRELAHQIAKHLQDLCEGLSDHPAIATVTGGLSVQKQKRLLEKAAIVISTPGRLWEVISSGHGLAAQIKGVRFLVIDEADRLLSEGHFKDLEHILNLFTRSDEGQTEAFNDLDEAQGQANHSTGNGNNPERQTLVWSATFSKDLQHKLAGKKRKFSGDIMSSQEEVEHLLRKLPFRENSRPRFVDCNPASRMASNLREGLIECPSGEKDLYLYGILLTHVKARALVFVNSISAVKRLVPFLLNLSLNAIPLHSQMPQKARLRSLEKFKEQKKIGSINILVATDVAARGLDIAGVDVVVHYHLPRTADAYVHRSGRTARAEMKGSSILICDADEVAGTRRLVAKVHVKANPNSGKASMIRSLDMDRKIFNRLKPRVTLAKELATATTAKEKKHSEDNWMRQAAEDLGVDYDSEDFQSVNSQGRGAGRRRKEKEARELSKEDIGRMKHDLRQLLSQRVNVGVSARYLTSGGVDVNELLNEEVKGTFLGRLDGMGFDED